MRYVNKSIGAVIETKCIISGGDWEAETKLSKRGKGGRKPRGADGDQLGTDEQDTEDSDESEE